MPNWCSNGPPPPPPSLSLSLEAMEQSNHDTDEGLLGALQSIGEWDYETADQEWGTKWDTPI